MTTMLSKWVIEQTEHGRKSKKINIVKVSLREIQSLVKHQIMLISSLELILLTHSWWCQCPCRALAVPWTSSQFSLIFRWCRILQPRRKRPWWQCLFINHLCRITTSTACRPMRFTGRWCGLTIQIQILNRIPVSYQQDSIHFQNSLFSLFVELLLESLPIPSLTISSWIAIQSDYNNFQVSTHWYDNY